MTEPLSIPVSPPSFTVAPFSVGDLGPIPDLRRSPSELAFQAVAAVAAIATSAFLIALAFDDLVGVALEVYERCNPTPSPLFGEAGIS